MESFIVKPIVSDYAVHVVGKKDIICICNIKENAELIADILNADQSEQTAYAYNCWNLRKFNISQKEN